MYQPKISEELRDYLYLNLAKETSLRTKMFFVDAIQGQMMIAYKDGQIDQMEKQIREVENVVRN